MTLWQITLDVLQTPGVLQTMAWLFAIAMIVGALLVGSWTNMWRWSIAFLLFIVAQEYMRRLVLIGIDQVLTPRPTILAAVTALVYLLGLLVGAAWKEYNRRPFVRERKRLQDAMQKVAETDPPNRPDVEMRRELRQAHLAVRHEAAKRAAKYMEA